MSSFGNHNMQGYDSRNERGDSYEMNGRYQPRSSYQPRSNNQLGHGAQSGGYRNPAYSSSSMEEVDLNDVKLRPNPNGHNNRAFIGSTTDDPQGLSTPTSPNNNVFAITSPSSSKNSASRYRDEDTPQPPSGSKSRKCRCITAIVIVLVVILIAVAVAMGVIFGSAGKQEEGPLDNTTTPSFTSNAFTGQITLNQTWSPELKDTSSQAYIDLWQNITSLLDAGFKSDANLSSNFQSSAVINFQPGSIIVIFVIRFNAPVEITIVTNRVKVTVTQADESLHIVIDSVTVIDLDDNEACADPDLILCNDRCRLRSAVLCNRQNDCGDWFDESQCPGQSASCDFESESICGYTVLSNPQDSDYKWTRNSGPTGTLNTGPSADNTYGNSTGHYMYTEPCPTTCVGSGARTYLISSWYVSRKPSCLTFFYSMRGSATQMGPLYVSALNQSSQYTVLWTRENPDSLDLLSDWHQVDITLAAGSYQLLFASFHRAGSVLADKAIDDVSLTVGECVAPECKVDEYYCEITSICLATHTRCDGVFDCPNGQDERDCPGYQVKCDFESGDQYEDVCGLKASNKGTESYKWRSLKGSSTSSPLATSITYFDNTFRNEYGYYLTALPALGQTIDSKARLETSETLTPHAERCLRFAYQMFDSASQSPSRGNLKVYAKIVMDNSTTEVWTQRGAANNVNWNRALITLKKMPDDYVIVLEAERGTDTGITISIDDLTITEGFCKCEDPGRRQCPERTCIPNEWFCDGQPDCDGGVDEQNCPTCTSSEFQCNDFSCVAGGESIRCDGTYDCIDGSDEKACASEICQTPGCVKLRHTDGLSYEACSDGWTQSLTNQVCRYLGNKPSGTHVASPADSNAEFLQLIPANSGFMNRFRKVTSCPSNTVIHVDCEPETCGHSSPSFSPYIIGGNNVATSGRWPWQISLRVDSSHNCGGSIVNDRWIVTAAHCLAKDNDPAKLRVNVGAVNLNDGQNFNVSSIYIHPDYLIEEPTAVIFGNDIALLYLSSSIQFTNTIRPICLPDPDELFSSRSLCYTTGWGADQVLPIEYPSILQEAKYKLYDTDSCNETISRVTGKIKDSMVCAGYSSGTIRTCLADSGGPLTCKDKYQRWVLTGITSYGPPGCLLQDHHPDVFTRVTSFLSWITDYTDYHFTCATGEIIRDRGLLCDGKADCSDGSDETDESCVRKISCTFESKNLCGYTRDRWNVVSGSSMLHGPLSNGGPSFDHTMGLADGIHQYLLTSSHAAILSSPSVNVSSDSCIEFYYYMTGNNSKLTVSKSGATEGLKEFHAGAGTWMRGLVNVAQGSYSIQFQADMVLPAFVAVDDIWLMDGACPEQCDGSHKCLDGQCVLYDYVCDGLDQCFDYSSNEELSCQGIFSEIVCEFDAAGGCDLRQSIQDSYDWRFIYQKRFLLPNGPSSGHVGADDIADYNFLLARPRDPQDFDSASLIWPLSIDGQWCFTFWYIMYGDSVGVLSIRQANSDIRLWEMWGNKGNEWRKAEVQLDTSAENSFITIHTKSSIANGHFVALDDFAVTQGECSTPAACAGHRCSNGECIVTSKVCDRVVDCPDTSDESQCNFKVNCDFSSICSDYTITAATVLRYTWNRNQEVLQAISDQADFGSSTTYTSSPLVLNSMKCLQFHYKLTGAVKGNAQLKVNYIVQATSQPVNVWTMSKSRADWTTGLVQLERVRYEAIKLQFQASFGGVSGSDIQIDDITLSDGSCTYASCAANQFLCRTENLCISMGQHCDGTFDCQSGEDEQQCGAITQLVDCNFDDGLCDWTQPASPGINLKLERNRGSTVQAETGPEYDHTQQNLLGYYLYIDIQDTLDGRAHVVSPELTLSSEHCITFYYHMIGLNIQSLQLNNLVTGNNLMYLNGTQGYDWLRGKATLPAGKVIVEFLLQSRGRQGHTALDDITIRPGACECGVDFSCSDGTCIDKNVTCDASWQCKDGGDETSELCGCYGDFLCVADGNCIPEEFVCEDHMGECFASGDYIDCSKFEGQCPENSTYLVCSEGLCLESSQFCNGHPDCPVSGDDEPINCAENCPVGMIACEDKSKCILTAYWCDGHPDCDDGSDERVGCVGVIDGSGTASSGCENESAYICADGRILARHQYCDGQIDCSNAEDEPNRCECCENIEFACQSSSRCISKQALCNSVYDCPDLSDEMNCECGQNGTRCDQGLCVLPEMRCNGTVECLDLTDELQCECAEREFRCDNGRCVSPDKRCNGVDDCLDVSDEKFCNCTHNMVECDDGRCIPDSWLCDGFPDCTNGSDERNCGNCPHFQCLDYTCLNSGEVCDGVVQCPLGEDESTCVNQTSDGIIQIRINSQSYYLCYQPSWSSEWSKSICRSLDQSHAAGTYIVPALENALVVAVNANNFMSSLPVSRWVTPADICESGSLVKISCVAESCGTKSVDQISPYLIGGEIVPPGESWPWMSAVYFSGEYTGAASYVGRGWFITAAHVIRPPNFELSTTEMRDLAPHLFTVETGTKTRGQGQVHNVERILIHPQFNALALRYDIALIKTALNDSSIETEPVCVGKTQSADEDVCFSIGWGSVNTDSIETPVTELREARVQQLDLTACQHSWNRFSDVFIPEIMLCTNSSFTNTCHGDSGGPLMCRTGNKYPTWNIVGISSGGETSCLIGRRPPLFTRISFFSSWISSVTGITLT